MEYGRMNPTAEIEQLKARIEILEEKVRVLTEQGVKGKEGVIRNPGGPKSFNEFIKQFRDELAAKGVHMTYREALNKASEPYRRWRMSQQIPVAARKTRRTNRNGGRVPATNANVENAAQRTIAILQSLKQERKNLRNVLQAPLPAAAPAAGAAPPRAKGKGSVRFANAPQIRVIPGRENLEELNAPMLELQEQRREIDPKLQQGLDFFEQSMRSLESGPLSQLVSEEEKAKMAALGREIVEAVRDYSETAQEHNEEAGSALEEIAAAAPAAGSSSAGSSAEDDEFFRLVQEQKKEERQKALAAYKLREEAEALMAQASSSAAGGGGGTANNRRTRRNNRKNTAAATAASENMEGAAAAAAAQYENSKGRLTLQAEAPAAAAPAPATLQSAEVAGLEKTSKGEAAAEAAEAAAAPALLSLAPPEPLSYDYFLKEIWPIILPYVLEEEGMNPLEDTLDPPDEDGIREFIESYNDIINKITDEADKDKVEAWFASFEEGGSEVASEAASGNDII